MDFIPLVCGTYPRQKVDFVHTDCPVCHGHGTVNLVKAYQRCCLCFVPLCKVGGESQFGQCSSCGSSLPPSLARRAALQATYPTTMPTQGERRLGGGDHKVSIDSASALVSTPQSVDYAIATEPSSLSAPYGGSTTAARMAGGQKAI